MPMKLHVAQEYVYAPMTVPEINNNTTTNQIILFLLEEDAAGCSLISRKSYSQESNITSGNPPMNPYTNAREIHGGASSVRAMDVVIWVKPQAIAI